MNDDFAAHNEEQKRVWEAFHAFAPIRVPVYIGTNPRMMLLDPARNPDGITFQRYMSDSEVMLDVMIACEHWNRHHLWYDHEMGLPSDGWRVGVDLQNVFEAAWLGAPVRFPENNCPYASPLLTDDTRNLLFDEGLPDPFNDVNGWIRRAWEFYDIWTARKEEPVTFHGCPIHEITPPAMGTDGPFTLAMELRGGAACLDMLADPDYFHQLMTFITDATILRMKAYRRRVGRPIRDRDFGFADDSIALISTEHFREHVLPYYRRLVDTFWNGQGWLSIHLCGDASRHFPILKDELGVTLFDTGFPIDLHEMRRQLGPDVLLQGGPRVDLLRNGPVDEIVRVTRDLLEGPAADGMFLLREANNLAPATPPENIRAMYDTARSFARI